MSLANEAIMRKLCSLYVMYWMVQNSGEFMTVSCFASQLRHYVHSLALWESSVSTVLDSSYHCIVIMYDIRAIYSLFMEIA